MLDISVEFTKGVLFVRLEGKINNFNSTSVKKTLIDILDEGGIRYVVFNIKNLIILDDVDLFEKCDELIKANDGQMLICGLGNNNKGTFEELNVVPVDDELSALKVLNAC